MASGFPSSPSNGQIYTTTSGISFIYISSTNTWNVYGSLPVTYINGTWFANTAPSNTQYAFWYQSNTGTFSVYDGSSNSWIQVSAEVATSVTSNNILDASTVGRNLLTAANLDVQITDLSGSFSNAQKQVWRYNIGDAPWEAYAYQNLAVNPRMQIAQFGTGTTGLSAYVVDGTGLYSSGPTMTANQISSPFVSRPDLLYGLQANVTTACTSPNTSNIAEYYHNIEGIRLSRLLWGTANAYNLFVGMTVNTTLAGNYYVSIRNGLNYTRGCIQKMVLSASTDTFVPLIFPGDTTVNSTAWPSNTSSGAQLSISLGGNTSSGNYTISNTLANTWQTTTYGPLMGSDQTNWMGTAGAKFTISDLILLPVPASVTNAASVIPTDRLPFFQRQYDDELRICQRYYRLVTATTRSYASAAGAFSDCTISYSDMRIQGTATRISGGATGNISSENLYTDAVNAARFEVAATATGDFYAIDRIYSIDARL